MDTHTYITRFIIQNGDLSGREVSISAVLEDAGKPVFIIGSDPRALLQLTAPGVAPAHAAITLKDGAYLIQPRFPTLDVLVNGRRIEGSTRLSPGDTVEIGGVRLGFGRVERLTADSVALPAPVSAPTPGTASAIVASQPKPVAARPQPVYTPNIYFPTKPVQHESGGKTALVAAFAVLFAVIAVVGAASRFGMGGAPALEGGFDPEFAYRDGNISFVMFDAVWCQYCKQQQPIVNGLADEYRGDMYVTHVDIDHPANRELVSRYGGWSIPYMVIINDEGEISATFRGLTNREVLRRAIDKALRESALSPNVEATEESAPAA